MKPKGLISDAVEILRQIPRVSEKTALNMIEHFLSDTIAWADFKKVMEVMMSSGYCICGNFASDANQQYDGKNLCEYCREDNREGIVLIPNIRTISKMEDILPGRYWYHVITATDTQSETETIHALVKNIQHKMSYDANPISVVSALGSDALSNEVFLTIIDTLKDVFGDSVKVSKLPIGIPMDTPIQKVGDATLRAVLMMLDSNNR